MSIFVYVFQSSIRYSNRLFGYNNEGPLSKHSTVQNYEEDPTKDVFILAYKDNDVKNTLINNAYDKLTAETLYYLLDTTIRDDGFYSKDNRIAQAIDLLYQGLNYELLDQSIKSSYHNPHKKQWYNIQQYYTNTDVYIHKDGLDYTPEIVDVNQPVTSDNLIKIIENGKPTIGGLNTIYAVANYDTPNGRGILDNDIQALSDVHPYKGKDVFVVQYGKNNDKLFVTSMNSNQNNFSKLQNHTETWANAKISQVATNGAFVSNDAKDFINQSSIMGQGKLSSDKLQEFTDLNIPQISNAQDFIDGLSELSTNDMTL